MLPALQLPAQRPAIWQKGLYQCPEALRVVVVLRVAELEEELDDTDDAAGQDTSVSPENALTGHENEVVSAQPDTVTDTADLVTVVALVTLHTDALHATRDEAVAFVLPGTAFRVSAGVAAEMTERGLARMQ